VPRLLLITHRALDQAGGPSARWRSLSRHLPELGWQVDVLSAPSHPTSSEFALDMTQQRFVARRAGLMSPLRTVAGPFFRLLGTRPLPLSTLWIARGVIEARGRLRRQHYDIVVATAPPMIALVVARLAMASSRLPLIIDLRDLWAGNPAYDSGGRALTRAEAWVLRRAQAAVVCTPEAAIDLRGRHRTIAARVHVVTNGFEKELLARRRAPAPRGDRMLTILHSGTLTLYRPLTPLLRVLRREPYRSCVRLLLHGYLVPELAREARAAAAHCEIEILRSSTWNDAVERIAAADVALITQARSAGDATAVASKVYEYLALGKPVLCLSDGGATEALLRRLGAHRWCARLHDEEAIAAAIDDLLACTPPPLSPDALAPYDRLRLAAAMSELLDSAAGVARTGVSSETALSAAR